MYTIYVKKRTKQKWSEHSSFASAHRAFTSLITDMERLQIVLGMDPLHWVEFDYKPNYKGNKILKKVGTRFHNNSVELYLEVNLEYYYEMGRHYLATTDGRSAVSTRPNPYGRILMDKEPHLWLPIAEKYVKDSVTMSDEELKAFFEELKEDVGF